MILVDTSVWKVNSRLLLLTFIKRCDLPKSLNHLFPKISPHLFGNFRWYGCVIGDVHLAGDHSQQHTVFIRTVVEAPIHTQRPGERIPLVKCDGFLAFVAG